MNQVSFFEYGKPKIKWEILAGYHLNSDSNDSIGGYNGVDTSVTYGSGRIGSCGIYNGSTSKSVIGNIESLKLSAGTISCWIKTTGAGSSYRFIFGKTSAYGLFLYDNKLAIYDWGSPGLRDTGVLLNDGAWHHIALVFGGSFHNGKIYIDGSLISSVTMVINDQTGSVLIGGNFFSGSYSQFFNGSIDDAFISPKICNDSEILKIYNNGVSGISIF